MAEGQDSGPGNVTVANGDDDIIQLGNNAGGASGSDFVDPVSATAPRAGVGGSDSGPRRRGRPPGSGNKSKSEKAPKNKNLDLGPFAGILFGIHSMLASVSKTPELELDAGESEKLAKASYGVMLHYMKLDVSEKAADWFNLFMVVGGIYGPRIFAAKFRRQNQASANRQQRQNTATVQEAATPKPAGGGNPSTGASVVSSPVIIFPQAFTGTGDMGGTGGGPGVG